MEQNPNTNPEHQPEYQNNSPTDPLNQEKPVPTTVPTPRKAQMPAPVTPQKPPNEAVPYRHSTADSVPLTDKICYESEDKQFIVHQLVRTAAKFPPSNYPCVVLRCQPHPHTRVRKIEGDYVEIMPTFKELEEFVVAINDAAIQSGKGKLYELLQRVPEKTVAHKKKWRRYNEQRLGIRGNGGRYGSK